MQKYYVGPMSKPIVDAFLDFTNPPVFIPSRRQIDFNGGYVNNWTTESFANYVKSTNKNSFICRDHAGPEQGSVNDDGFESLKHDCLHFDMIHIDPWKKYSSFQDGINHTVDMINFCLKQNPKINFEISTEQSIKYFSSSEIEDFCKEVYINLKRKFESIKFIVIQSGTALEGNNQIGRYCDVRLTEMIKVVKKFDKLSKEHNGDYISKDVIFEKFSRGLDAINIAPEFGFIQTNIILEEIDEVMFHDFWQICYDSKKWVKWVPYDFDPFKNKLELIQICGHYVFSNKNFIEKIYSQIDVEEKIKLAIKSKMNDLNII